MSAAVLAVTSHLSVREVLQTIVTSARRLLDAEYAALGVPDADGVASPSSSPTASATSSGAAIGPVPRQHGLLGVMLRDPNPVRLADIRAHPELRVVAGGASGTGGLPRHADRRRRRDPRRAVPGEQAHGRRLHARTTRTCCSCSPRTPRSRWSTPGSSNAAESCPSWRNGTGSPASCTTPMSQKLFSLRLTAEAAATLLARDPDQAAGSWTRCAGSPPRRPRSCGRSWSGCGPADLAGDGLDVGAAQAGRPARPGARREVRFGGRRRCPGLDPAGREDGVYRIAQEALHNALRHGAPHQVEVRLTVHSGRIVVLEVADDGHGLRRAVRRRRMAAARRGSGIASMRERARAAGGRLAVSSRPGAGTTVRLEVPVDG